MYPSEDSSPNKTSEDEISHISPTIRRRLIESSTEDETNIENENQNEFDLKCFDFNKSKNNQTIFNDLPNH